VLQSQAAENVRSLLKDGFITSGGGYKSKFFHKYFGFCAASQIFAGLNNRTRLVSKCPNVFSIVIAQKRAEKKGVK
jgi:hypothetical protein